LTNLIYQNTTALHWAAINARVDVAQYLIEHGADINAVGGDLLATPMQWAARSKNLQILRLFIKHGADLTIRDSQGYNILHSVTHTHAVIPLLYLLQQSIDVDSTEMGNTSLARAAYEGDPLSVNLFLKHGANPNSKNSDGYTPLHWAVVKGNTTCIRWLIEGGADVSAKDAMGRTPRDLASELKKSDAWKQAMEAGDMTENGVKRVKPLSEVSSPSLWEP
jgi:palmitoyltransferase ZDHHC13/17